jgi:hypothetical protein
VQVNYLNLAQFTRVTVPAAPVQRAQPSGAPARDDLIALGLARVDLLALQSALNELGDLLGLKRTSIGSAVELSSSSPLGLDNTTTPTVLESVEEINTVPTSFGPFGPAWTGSSTALATISGVYDGLSGTGTLSFEVRGEGVHGQDRLRVRVRDVNNSVLQNITIQANDPIDQQYALGNGLLFRLGAGNLIRNDTFTVNVYDSVGSVVDTSNPFDGTRNAIPNFDPGFSASAGSFLLNGVQIDVAANDSIDSIISQINQSAAGVTASFDGARERVVLTQNTPGSVPPVVVSNDASGLVDALKLTAAVAVPGRDPDLDQPLANLSQFQSVQSGTVRINGVDVAVDVQTDSLAAVLDRINQSQQDATATYTTSPERVLLAAVDAGIDLSVDDGGTGLFAALGIASGYFRAEQIGDRRRAAAVTDAVQLVGRRLNDFLVRGRSNGLLNSVAAQLDTVLNGSLSTEASYGLRLGFDNANRLGIDARELSRALQFNERAARGLLVGENQGTSAGLVGSLLNTVDQAIRSLDGIIGSRSAAVDLYA